MPIKMVTTPREIEKFLKKQTDWIRIVAIRNLAYVGEMAVTQARSLKSFKNITGNLRSSIGYIVVVDGKIVQMSSF
jgi:hypothetical protein